ncbi:MAG: D-glycero-beta-D-manno-heptose 1-phosphate adenylyltransferase [Desulfarculaceae bacterium]|nr:D-glycero-beta-D-manno-heptose 1-phosphate adenylyltransferase [Desulfarculaceae bacterium]
MLRDKVTAPDQIERVAGQYRREKKRVGFTNGCFDILHAGHVMYLEKAAAFGDILIVGLNSDASVKRIKGPRRPVVPENERALVLSALYFVDHIVLFDEPDPGELIRKIRPDVLVKGADWDEDRIVGGEFVKQHGGDVQRISFEYRISTSQIIERIRKTNHAG